MLRGVPVLLVLSVMVSGCLQLPSESGSSECAQATITPEGFVIPPGESYWTPTTNQSLIPGGESIVAEIPGLTVTIEGEAIQTVTRDAVVDGEDWMDRRWPCHLEKLPIIAVNEGTAIEVTAASDEAETIRVAFHYRHPDGLDIGYAPEPDWQVDGPTLSETLPELREGRHDAFASVTHSDGTQRRHHFLVEYGPHA